MELYEIKRDPKPGYIVLIVITLLAFIAQVIFNAIQNDVFNDSKHVYSYDGPSYSEAVIHDSKQTQWRL